MKKQEKYREAFITNLKLLMYKHKVTQQVLADAVGLKRQTIALYESGGVSPKLEGIVAIAKYFNVSCDYLLGISRAKSLDDTVQTVGNMYGLKDESLETLSNIVDSLSVGFGESPTENNANEERLKALNVVLSDNDRCRDFLDFIYDILFLKPDNINKGLDIIVNNGVIPVRGHKIHEKDYRGLLVTMLYNFLEDIREKLDKDTKDKNAEKPTTQNESG
jgi:transcriptional regulator with XRE-family HTH domain